MRGLQNFTMTGIIVLLLLKLDVYQMKQIDTI